MRTKQELTEAFNAFAQVVHVIRRRGGPDADDADVEMFYRVAAAAFAWALDLRHWPDHATFAEAVTQLLQGYDQLTAHFRDRQQGNDDDHAT